MNRLDSTIDILNKVKEIAEKHPYLRFCQIIGNVTDVSSSAFYYMENDNFLKLLNRHYDNVKTLE